MHLSSRIVGQVKYRLIAAAIGKLWMLVKPRAMAVDRDLDPGQARTVRQKRQLQRVRPARLLSKIELDGKWMFPVSRPAVDRARLKGEPVVRGIASAGYEDGIHRGVRVVEPGFSGHGIQMTAEFGGRFVENADLPERLGFRFPRRR